MKDLESAFRDFVIEVLEDQDDLVSKSDLRDQVRDEASEYLQSELSDEVDSCLENSSKLENLVDDRVSSLVEDKVEEMRTQLREGLLTDFAQRSLAFRVKTASSRALVWLSQIARKLLKF
jgi:hypothetical protein